MTLIFLAIFFQFLLSVFTQPKPECTSSNISNSSKQPLPISDIKTGFLKILNSISSSNQRYSTYSQLLDIKESSTYDVLASPYFIYQYSDPNGVEFQVLAQLRDKILLVNFYMPVSANWRYVRIHYIVCNRDLLFVGSFSKIYQDLVSSPHNRTSESSKKLVLTTSFASKQQIRSRDAFVKAIITGVKINNNATTIRIVSEEIQTSDESIKKISVNLSLNNIDSIQSIRFGYIVNSRVNNEILVTQLQVVDSLLVNNIQNNQINDIFGIKAVFAANDAPVKGFVPSLNSLLNLNAASALLKQDITKFNRKFDLQALRIIVLNKLQPTILIRNFTNNELNSQKRCISFNECQKIKGTVLYLPNNTLSCILCAENAAYSFESGACQCTSDYYLNRSQKCVSISRFCQDDLFYYEGSCYQLIYEINNQCSQRKNQVYNAALNSCQCKPGYQNYTVKKVAQCRPQCRNNFVFDSKTENCTCYSNKIDLSGKCIDCPSSTSIWNETAKICSCRYRFSQSPTGQCYPCSTSASYDEQTKKCSCLRGYKGNGFICRREPDVVNKNDIRLPAGDVKFLFPGNDTTL